MSKDELKTARYYVDRSLRRTKNTLFTLLIVVFFTVVVLVNLPH